MYAYIVHFEAFSSKVFLVPTISITADEGKSNLLPETSVTEMGKTVYSKLSVSVNVSLILVLSMSSLENSPACGSCNRRSL